MKKLRRQTFYPKRSDVAKLKREQPHSLFSDTLGRIYGPYENNPIAEELENSSEIDQETRFALWIHLPCRTIDPSIPSREAVHLPLDEILDFPRIDEWIEYGPYLEPDVNLGAFRVLYYPERIQTNGASAAVVVEIQR